MILVLACAPDTHDKDALFFTKIEPLGPPLGIFQDPDKRTIYLFTFRSLAPTCVDNSQIFVFKENVNSLPVCLYLLQLKLTSTNIV